MRPDGAYWAIFAAALVVGVLAPSTPPSAHPASPPLRIDGPAASPPPAARLTIDPATWVLPAGANVSLSAAWSPSSAACAPNVGWFRWSILSTVADGSLTYRNGSVADFEAASARTGTTLVEVRSSASLDCDSAGGAVVASAFANVTVLAPLELENVSVVPAAIDPGTNASIAGTIVGGAPPYTLVVRWGDGTTSPGAVDSPGPFSVSHRFAGGLFAPEVLVNDSAGLSASATVEEPLDVSAALAVGVLPGGASADVGVPMPWRGTVINAPSTFSWSAACGPPSAIAMLFTGPASGSCTFSAPGTGEISFEAGLGQIDPSALAILDERVAPDPTLSASTSAAAGEVGATSQVGWAIDGGVPPFEVSWTLVGAQSSGTIVVPADGRFLVPVDSPRAGAFTLAVQALDAVDGRTATVSLPFSVAPALNVSVSIERTGNASGLALQLTGDVASGTAPFDWAVEAAPPTTGAAPAVGLLNGTGGFGWDAPVRIEGEIALTVVVLDADGEASIASNATLAIPPLAGIVSIGTNRTLGPDRFSLSLELTGGRPPFGVRVAGDSGAGWNLTVASDGPVSWILSVPAPGLVALHLTVVDALGYWLDWNGSVNVTGIPAAPASGAFDDDALWAIGAVALLVGVVVVGTRIARQRRRGSLAPPSPDAAETLRRIIAPADGADRSTVELLAEEAGVPLESARSTLDRLVREGVVRSEVDADGTEVVSWEGRAPP